MATDAPQVRALLDEYRDELETFRAGITAPAAALGTQLTLLRETVRQIAKAVIDAQTNLDTAAEKINTAAAAAGLPDRCVRVDLAGETDMALLLTGATVPAELTVSRAVAEAREAPRV